MNIRILIIGFILLSSLLSFSQVAPDAYYIQFTDKENSPYSIDQAEEFLSARSIARRTKYSIEISARDFPVNPQYLEAILEVGVEILNPTKWLNGVTVYTTDASLIETINELSFVESTSLMKNRSNELKKAYFEETSIDLTYTEVQTVDYRSVSEFDYGSGTEQIDQINGIPLHKLGYRGEGMLIAILDGGFDGADVHPAFDSLWDSNRIIETKDFVHPGGSVFNESDHGKKVLSCMGANIPGQFIGTAPMASFCLLRTEYVATENILEEYNWLSAAEYADSIGADVINSSLSYSDYDMDNWSHSYEDMDGNTAIATRAADYAASKGILVFNSAGNSGNGSWPWNGAPADADSIMSVGSVNSSGIRVSSSSIGPTADGRIKPGIMGRGSSATVASGNSGIGTANGTSFASPIIAGMSTCLLQKYPEKNVMEIIELIQAHGSYSNNPDNYYGWGIPDYATSAQIYTGIDNNISKNSKDLRLSPNPCTKYLNIHCNKNEIIQSIEIKSMSGKSLFSRNIDHIGHSIDIDIPDYLSKGVYLIIVNTNSGQFVNKLIKQ